MGHGTLRDGPGWRSIIYFKGCNFRCRWCGSPDTMSPSSEIMFHESRVKYPERLADSCPRGAIVVREKNISIERSLCRKCAVHECVVACIDGSVELSGRAATVGEIVGEVIQYRRAHREYGVTLSGGEAPMQWDFYLELLKAFKSHGMHTAVETNGSIARMADSFPWLDLMICDFKIADAGAHKRWTGRSNTATLRNIRKAVGAGIDVWVRIPVIPGVNDGENIEDTIEALRPLREKISVEILGYHRLGIYKWKALGKRYSLSAIEPSGDDKIISVGRRFTEAGFNVIRT
jgi:pyruvate formate lyase activating enzyme